MVVVHGVTRILRHEKEQAFMGPGENPKKCKKITAIANAGRPSEWKYDLSNKGTRFSLTTFPGLTRNQLCFKKIFFTEQNLKQKTFEKAGSLYEEFLLSDGVRSTALFTPANDNPR
jgi:hypothetical protein